MKHIFLHIIFSRNNILMTLLEQNSDNKNYYKKTLTTTSSGAWNFKNKHKNTPFACIFMLKKIITQKPTHIIFKGESFFRYLILHLLKKENIHILSISEKTLIPFNGCKYSRKKIKINE